MDDQKIRVAFSGGGFRATFYSLGAFRRLVELGLWEKVCRIDSVSGGSVTSGVIMSTLAEGKFKDIEDFDSRVTVPLKRLGQSRFRERITLPVFIFIGAVSICYLLLAVYFKIPLVIVLITYLLLLLYIRPTKLFSANYLFLLNSFFGNRFMKFLPSYPEWCVNATCLNTGKRFRFKQSDFGGNKIGVTENNDIKIGFAIACSAAFPPVFAPYKLPLAGRKFYFDWWKKEKVLNQNPPAQIFLSDGGVYDNLGSENILQEKDERNPFVIIDAGQYMPQWFPNLNPNFFENTLRIIETALDQIISLRRRVIYNATKKPEAERTYGIMLILGEPVKSHLEGKKCEDFGKLSDDVSSEMPAYDIFPDEIDKMTADLRTDLDSFHDIEIETLMWAGAVRMDIAVKRYLKKYLTEEKFKDTPKKPRYSIEKIKEVLTKGRQVKAPFGFLHKDVKAA